MAKKITRTVTTTNCKVFGVNPDTEECSYKVCVLSGTYKSEDKMLKDVRRVMDTEDFTTVKIVESEIKTELRAMSEDFFIQNSEVIPNRK